MPGRPEVIEPGGGMPLIEHRVAGGVVRLSTAALYALSLPEPGDPAGLTVILHQGLVWANVEGGGELQIRHGPTILRARCVQMLMDAGSGGEALVVVVAGELEVATPNVASTRLAAGAAGQLTPTGSITEVDGITEPELAADPWAQANRRLDAGLSAQEVVTEEPSPPPEVPAQDATTCVVLPVTSPDVDEEVEPRSNVRHPIRRELEVTGLLALALVLILAAVSFVLSGNHFRTSASKAGSGPPPSGSTTGAGSSVATQPTTEPSASPTSTLHPSTGSASSAPQAVPPGATSRPMRGQLTSCRQPSPGQVLVGGRVADPAGKARSYRVSVTLVGPSGSTLAARVDVIPARPHGASTPWTVPITPPRGLFGSQANCRLVEIDASD